MNKRLTTKELEAMRKRAEVSTGKEWTDFDGNNWSGVVYEYDRLTEDTCEIIAECRTQADAEFIACAREDIPALLGEVERLEIENKRLRKALYVALAHAVESTSDGTTDVITDTLHGLNFTDIWNEDCEKGEKLFKEWAK